MIDLRYRYLPNALEVDGVEYPIHTDFRVWIAWIMEAETQRTASIAIFSEEVPDGMEWVEVAQQFASNPDQTPTGKGARDRAYDFLEDGGRIVSGFMKDYGINLTDPDLEMHWHLFLELFRGLSDDTVMVRAMGYRTYSDSDGKQKYETKMKQAKKAWRLPERVTVDDVAAIDWQQAAFGKLTL